MPTRKTTILLAVIFSVIYALSFIGFSLILPNNSTTADSDYTSSDISSTIIDDNVSSNSSSTSGVNSSDVNASSENSSVDSSSDITSSENTSSTPEDNNTDDENTSDEDISVPNDFTVGMWISMYELNFKGKTETQFKSKIDSMLSNAINTGVTDIYCHVRPSGDAFYNSTLFPFSHFFSGTQGDYPGYDPFKYIVESAHNKGLKIHAWINPYRVASHNDLNKLADTNIAKIWLTDSDTSNDRYILTETDRNHLYFNPAIPEVRQYIISGVKEILDNYDVDGIQIDDYFYPTDKTYYDEVEYNQYKASVSGTALSLGDWRRANVNALVSGIYSCVHNYEGVVFGISPSSHISNDKTDKNYLVNYADIALWMSVKGYCDYIAPQLYYGYEYPTTAFQFNNLLDKWTSMPMHDELQMIIGLAPYKIDPAQRPAADGTEWTDDEEILAKELNDVLKTDCSGVALYSYSYVCDNKLSQKHTENFVNALKKR